MNEHGTWTPPPNDDMRDGLSFGGVVLFVGGGFFVLAVLAYFVVPWGKISFSRPQSAETVFSANESSETDQVDAPKNETQQRSVTDAFANTTSTVETTTPANLPPTRGFLVFRGKIVLLDKAEARISADRKKLILLINPKDAGKTADPALSVVLAFKHPADNCDKTDLEKFQLRINMTPFNTKGEPVVAIDRNPARNYLHQVNEMECDRRKGGGLDLQMVGSENILGGENMAWSFVLATKFQ